MARYAIPEPKIKTLPIVGKDEVFPVRRVYCIGRNYAAHAVEMGHDPDKEDPFFFQKNPDNLNLTGRFPYPPKSSDVHHEAEVLVADDRCVRCWQEKLHIFSCCSFDLFHQRFVKS